MMRILPGISSHKTIISTLLAVLKSYSGQTLIQAISWHKNICFDLGLLEITHNSIATALKYTSFSATRHTASFSVSEKHALVFLKYRGV